MSAKTSPERLAYAREYYQRNREKKLTYAREYQKNNPDVHREATRRHREKDPEATREYNRSYHRQNAERVRESKRATHHRRAEAAKEYDRTHRDPLKRKARWTVQNALRSGTIVKPDTCSECGSETPSRRLHAHHKNYSEPLNVRWLCTFCHGTEHRKA